mmetsp:Transcript_508/g.1536  ORF Transcript_508/g.1536 Transcript_508/m.1536 type:complete len:103 (+) Transcript_508:211-519(+)
METISTVVDTGIAGSAVADHKSVAAHTAAVHTVAEFRNHQFEQLLPHTHQTVHQGGEEGGAESVHIPDQEPGSSAVLLSDYNYPSSQPDYSTQPLLQGEGHS